MQAPASPPEAGAPIRHDPLSRLARGLGEWMAPLFLVAVLISVYEVVLRYLFNAPTLWVHETTVLLSAACFLVSGLYTLERGEHIRITVLSDRLPRPLRVAADWLGFLLAVIFLGGLAWGGWKAGWEALSNWQTTATALDSPTPAILRPLIVVVSALMVLLLLVQRRPPRGS